MWISGMLALVPVLPVMWPGIWFLCVPITTVLATKVLLVQLSKQICQFITESEIMSIKGLGPEQGKI